MIRSIATITVAPARTALTTLQRAKDELSITDSASDARPPDRHRMSA